MNYIKNGDELGIGKLILDNITAPKKVDSREFTFGVHDLLGSVGFSLYLNGYKYLAVIVERYLLDDDFSYEKAVTEICTKYTTTKSRVLDSIYTSIIENKLFAYIAQLLLNSHVTLTSKNLITSTVEMLGTIFKRYFNYYLQ